MTAFVDLAIVAAVIGVARSGWRRGMVFFVVDLLGFAVAVALAVRFHEVPATFFGALGLSDRWADVTGGLVIFVPIIVVVASVGSRLSKAMYKPGLYTVDRILGAATGAVFALTVIVVGLLFARSAFPQGLGDLLVRSAIARGVVETAAPVVALADDRLGLELCGGRLAQVVPELCEGP